MSTEEFKWYIIHSLAGSEKKVAQAITEQAAKKNISDFFSEIIVPIEQVVEVRRGQKVNAEYKFLPGYILIKMKLSDESWHLVRNIPKVSGFLGSGSKPQPVSEKEIERFLDQMKEGVSSGKNALNFEVGESVKVIDGPFESFVGVVEELDVEKSRLKVSFSIFGRATPVELEYSQVEKLQS